MNHAHGRVFKYGDNIDTDVIIPARYLNSTDPSELATHCMVDIDPTFAGRVEAGDIMVGEKNFGCGSSREHAPLSIKASGISCVIAESLGGEFDIETLTASERVMLKLRKKELVSGEVRDFVPCLQPDRIRAFAEAMLEAMDEKKIFDS